MRKVNLDSLLKREITSESAYLDGALSKLRRSLSSTEDYLKEFIVTSAATLVGSHLSVFNPDDDDDWCTCDLDYDPWIQIEMKNKQISFQGYKLTTFDNCCGYPKTWYIEGRNSKSENWQRIDTRTDEASTDNRHVTVSFTNNVLSTCKFKIIKLTLTNCWVDGNFLSLSELDFIGSVMNMKKAKTQVCSRGISPKIVSFLIFLLVNERFMGKEHVQIKV